MFVSYRYQLYVFVALTLLSTLVGGFCVYVGLVTDKPDATLSLGVSTPTGIFLLGWGMLAIALWSGFLWRSFWYEHPSLCPKFLRKRMSFPIGCKIGNEFCDGSARIAVTIFIRHAGSWLGPVDFHDLPMPLKERLVVAPPYGDKCLNTVYWFYGSRQELNLFIQEQGVTVLFEAEAKAA